jgi:hypothetical protein
MLDVERRVIEFYKTIQKRGKLIICPKSLPQFVITQAEGTQPKQM